MHRSKYAILVFLLFSFHAAFSQVITVTDNKDSGPGTLRQALLSIPANNTTDKFTIKFALPGTATDANRTIRLRSALPVVPSNVTIDGSTQNWPALGISGAKIILEPEFPGSTFSGLVIGQYWTDNVQTKNVEIYGLYLRNFATITNLQNVNISQGSGIVVDYRANGVKIGAPGKGNVICGNINGILIQNYTYYDVNPVTNMVIQSNMIGVIYDGTTPNPNVTGINASLYDSSITIGGDNQNEGNVVSANQTNLNINRNNYSSNNRFEINIINNKIGTDYSGTKDFHDLPLFLSSSSLEIYGVKVNASSTQLYMRNNIVSGNRTWAVSISNSDFILTGNSIGTGKDGTEKLGNGGGIRIESNASGTIGGATAAETNRIGNNGYGVESTSTRSVKITRNSMFCNKVFGIGKSLNNFQPYVQLLKKRSNYVSGRATPNSEVELFSTENCEGNCEGRTYFKTVQAGSDGKWEYSGTITGNVTATASLLNATTSPFSTAALLENEAIVEPVTCNSNGSITIPESREGITFQWNQIINNVRIPRGTPTTQKITDLEVGSYEVIINDGCKAITSQIFEVKDQKLTKPVITPIVPGCGQLTFQFSATVFRGKGNIIYKWFNKTDQQVAEGQTVSLPEGTYKVKVKDEANCEDQSDFIIVTRKPAPIINYNSMNVTRAACGHQDGSIKGISVTDITGTATYKWYLYNNRTGTRGALISGQNSRDLENVAGDLSYILEVTDNGSCSPVYSQPIYIEVYNSVTISSGNITPATCGGNNGAISNIVIKEADRYQWFNPAGDPMGPIQVYDPATPPSLKDLPAGTYKLVASNSKTPCTLPASFTVLQLPKTDYIFSALANPTTCGLHNGSIVLTYAPGTPRPFRFKWLETISSTELTGTDAKVDNLPVGSYKFFTYDINGCETIFGPYIIEPTPLLRIEPSTGKRVNDGCTLSRGSVTGVKVSGGIPPYTYEWYNENGEKIQSTLDLIGVSEGKYRLRVKDITTCGDVFSEEFAIENPSLKIQTPVINDLRTCYATEIMLPVTAPLEGTYQMYEDMNDLTPVRESTTGIFTFKIAKTSEYYIRRKLGSCYSNFTKVHIEVTNDNLEIMNTMTPNGDGMNDTWEIKGLPEHSDYTIKLYTRSGQLIYESNGKYVKPFDGRFRGEELPAGVYYFIIDLKADCKPLGGSLTLLR